MEHSPCARTGHRTATPTSSVREQEKLEKSAEAPPRPPEEHIHPAPKTPQERDPTQKQLSRKQLAQREKSINEKRDEGLQPVSSKRPVSITSTNAIAAAPVTTSSRSALGSPVFADLPVSSSARSGIQPRFVGLASGFASASVSGGHHFPGSTSKAKISSYDKMEALGGGSGYPYGGSYMVPGNAAAYKPGSNVPPSQLHLRGAWPPPHMEGLASLPVGASSLYQPYLSLSGLSPSGAPLGGVAFLHAPSLQGSDGQPVPATIHPPHMDSKGILPFSHSAALKEKESLSQNVDGAKLHALPKRSPALHPPKLESDVITTVRSGKHDRLVSREGHGNESQSRQNQHQTSGKRYVKEEAHPHVENSAAKFQSDNVGEAGENRTLKRGSHGAAETAKGHTPPSHSRDKRESGSDGGEKKRKSSKKKAEHSDENGNSLKTNDGKSSNAAKATASGRLVSPTGGIKVPAVPLGSVNSMGTVLSVGIETYAHNGEVPHTSSLLKTVSPPLSVPRAVGDPHQKLLQKTSPGASPVVSPSGTSHTHAKRHSPKDFAKKTSESGVSKHGKDDKPDDKSPKRDLSPGDKLTSPNTGISPSSISPRATVSTPSETSLSNTSPSTTSTVQLGYMPMYLPNTCQLSLEKESNKDAPKSGTKVHATTFVPAPGEFIPGPATNATVGLSVGKESKGKTSPSSPASGSRRSPVPVGNKIKSGDPIPGGKRDAQKTPVVITKSSSQSNAEFGHKHDENKASKSSGEHADSGKGHSVGVEPKDDMHSKNDDVERKESHNRKRHLSGNGSIGTKHVSRNEHKPERTTSHSSGKHSDRARSVSGPDQSASGMLSPRETNSKHSDRHALDKSAEDHRRMELLGRVSHPGLYYDVGAVSERSRTDPSLPIPGFHGDCFSSPSATHEALARQESMLRTALMGSTQRMSTGTCSPLVSSPTSQPFLVSSHGTPGSTSHASSTSKKTASSSSDITSVQGRGTPGIKASDGRCPPIGIAVAQQRQDGDSTGAQGRTPARSSSRSASSSPHVSRVIPSSADKREHDDERTGRSRESTSASHGRLAERDQRTGRDQSPRESRSTSELQYHLGAHRRYPHDLSANLVVTGGGSIGRPDTTIHPHLPATPHHWLPRPPSHASTTPSPLWPYSIPSSSPITSSSLEASPRGSPFPVGPGGMHWAQDPTTGQLMLVPPHPAHPESPLSNLAMWPRYLVPPHLQPHSHQLQQLMLNQFPYGPLPGPAHPSQHASLLQHIPGAGSSVEMQALLQQQQEAIANMYRHAEQERQRKDPAKQPGANSECSSAKLTDSLKGLSGHHRNRRESGDVKGDGRPESRQSDRSRTSSQEPLDIKHSLSHAQPSFLQAIPVAASQHHPLPFMYPPPVPYLYENPPPPSSGQHSLVSRTCQESKEKKEYPSERLASLPTHGPSSRSSKEKKESGLKSTSVQTSPAETPPAPTTKAEDACAVEEQSDSSNQSAVVSRTQQTEVNQKVIIEPNIDVVTVDSPDVQHSSSPPAILEVTSLLTKTEKQDNDRETQNVSQQISIQTESESSDSICVKTEEVQDNISVEKDNISTETQGESVSEEQTKTHDIEQSDVHEPEQTKATSTHIEASSSDVDSSSAVAQSGDSAVEPSSNRETLITNVMTTMQTFASSVDGLDQDQLAAIEGIALLSEVAERKAIATRAEFWNCVAEQHRTENSTTEQADDAESTTTETSAPLQGNSVSAMTSSGGCDLDDDALAGIGPGELSLKISCPITIKKEANGRSEVSACGAPLTSSEGMNPMELEMRMKLAELQRKYKEKKKELDKLQKKKDKKAKEDSKANSPAVEKRRGRGRPRKRKFSNKSNSDTAEPSPKEEEVKTLHSSATVLLEAAASLEEPEPVPKKKKKKEHKVKKEGKEKSGKLKKSKKLKTKTDSDGLQTSASSDTLKPLTKKKKDKDKDKSSLKSTSLASQGSGQVTTVKVKGTKTSKKRTGSPITGEISSKKKLFSKSASKKFQAANLASQDSFTSDTDSGSIIWPNKATPSSPSSASVKRPKSPKTKTKVSKKLKNKDGKPGLSSGRKKKSKSKEGASAGTPSSNGAVKREPTPPKLHNMVPSESKPKSGLSIERVYSEDSDSTLDDGSTTTNLSSQVNSWSSHKGLALLAELSSNQSSSRCATPTKTKKKKIKDKTKSSSSSSSEKSKKTSSSKTESGSSIKRQQGDGTKLVKRQQGDGTKLVKRQQGDGTKLVKRQQGDGTKLVKRQQGDGTKLIKRQQNNGTKLIKRQQNDGTKLIKRQQNDGTKLMKRQQYDGTKLIKRQQGDGTKLIKRQQGDGTKLIKRQQSDGTKLIKRQQSDGTKLITKKLKNLKTIKTVKTMKTMKKKLSATNSGTGKGTILKKMKKMGKSGSKSPIRSLKGEKSKKFKSNSERDHKTGVSSRARHETSPPVPQFDERSWCRRRSERIFLSDISPIQSRDISPQRKTEVVDAAKKKLMQTPNKSKPESTSPTTTAAGMTVHGAVVSQIGSVLDALKTDPLQMRKKLIRLSAQEEDDDDDDGRPLDEVRRKKLKKKAKKKDKTPIRGKMSPLELALVAKDLTDSSDSDGENVPLSCFVDRPSTPAPRNCVLSVSELQDGLRVLIPIDGLFHAGNVRAIQPPDVYGVVIEGGRGSRPHVFSQEQILQEAIADVKPSSTRYLPEGTRICAYWSQQYKYLYPGTVVKGSPNPTLDSNFTTVEFDDGDSGRIPLDHIRMLPQDFPIVNFEPSPIMVQRKRRRRPSETSSTTEWKMDLMKDDLDADDGTDGKSRDYSWRSQSSRDDIQAISEGDNDVFLPSHTSPKKTSHLKSLKKFGMKKNKTKLKLKNKVKRFSSNKSSSSSEIQKRVSTSPSLAPKLGKLTKVKKRKGVSAKFAEKVLQKKSGKVFAVKSKKSKDSSSSGIKQKMMGMKKKGTKKKLGSGASKAKCTVEIETVYSSEVFPDDLGFQDDIDISPSGFDSDDSSDDESDHYTKNTETLQRKKKTKKRRKSSPSSSCNVSAAFSPPRQFWRWLGKATQRRGSKGKARKLFYKSIVRDKEIIRVGECAVFLSTGRPHLPYIGRIESMWESWGGMMVVRVKWFYHPEETKGGRKPNDGKMALYLSQHVDENDVQTISHKCEVMSIDDYKQYASGKKAHNTMVSPHDIYYLAGTYDPGSGHTVSAN